MRVGVTIADKPAALFDWQADAEVDHGDRSLTGKLPRDFIGAEQGAPVTLWRGPDDALWSGEITTDPRLEDEMWLIRAHGGAEKVAALSSQAGTLPFYRVDGAERFSASDGDPYGFVNNMITQIDAEATAGRIRFTVSADESLALNGKDGVAAWIEGGLITRLMFTFHRLGGGTANFVVRTSSFTGPSGTLSAISDLSTTTADGTVHTVNFPTPEDGVEIRFRVDTSFTPSVRNKMWLTGLKMYGRTTDDAFSASEVVADVAGMAGLGTDGVQTNSLAVLPLLWEEEHPALLDYMAELSDWRWLVRHDGLHFGPYERTWDTATGHGAAPSLEPEERANTFVQPWRTVGGALRRATATADPDPFPGQTITTYGDELEDPQPDGTLAQAVATAAVAYESSVRMAGSVELTEVRYRGAPRDPVDVYAGDLLNLTDLAPTLGPQRVAAITYRQQGGEGRVRVSAQIGSEFNLVRTLREADRPRKRTRKRRRKRRR